MEFLKLAAAACVLDRVAAITATSQPYITVPAIIIQIPNTRPLFVVGDISPYLII